MKSRERISRSPSGLNVIVSARTNIAEQVVITAEEGVDQNANADVAFIADAVAIDEEAKQARKKRKREKKEARTNIAEQVVIAAEEGVDQNANADVAFIADAVAEDKEAKQARKKRKREKKEARTNIAEQVVIAAEEGVDQNANADVAFIADAVAIDKEAKQVRKKRKREKKEARTDIAEQVVIAAEEGVDQNANADVAFIADAVAIDSALLAERLKNQSEFSAHFPYQPRGAMEEDTEEAREKARKMDTFHLIIDNPHITMKQPMIDSDIVAIVDRVLNNEDIIGHRSNAFFAIVTGMGRGKTRTLVEMDREMNSREGVLSVAITYNHRWERRSQDESLPTPIKHLEYPLSVVTRILSIHYRQNLSRVVHHVKQNWLTTIIKRKTGEDDALFMIRECIRCIVRQQRDNNVVVNKFVLLMDESSKIEDDLDIKNVHNVLRRALLDEPLFDGTEEHVEVELVMSCLEVSSTGITTSSRPIHTITTPEVLNPQFVLDQWWLANVAVTLTCESRFKLLKLISTMNGLPRALQFGASKFEQLANQYLRSFSSSSSLPCAWKIEAAMITELYEAVRKTVSDHYPNMREWNLSPELTKAMLFCEKILVDDKVMKSVRQGIFTNSLHNLQSEGETTIYPKTTMLTLDIMSLNCTGQSIPKLIREMVDGLLENIKTGNIKAGDPLEIISNGLINARLLALGNLAQPNQIINFNIAQLFLIENPVDLTPEVNVEQNSILSGTGFLEADRTILKYDRHFYRKSMSLRKSYSDNASLEVGRLFLEDANKTFPVNENIAKLSLVPNECADGGWLLRSSPFRVSTLMVDCKSYKELMPDEAPNLLVPPFESKQALHFNNMTERINGFAATGGFTVKEGSMAHSIREKDTLFVYLMTKDRTTTIGDRVLYVGDADTRRFLCFMEPFYGVCRTIIAEIKKIPKST